MKVLGASEKFLWNNQAAADSYIQSNTDFCSYWRLTAKNMLSALYGIIALLGVLAGLVIILYLISNALFADFMKGVLVALILIVAIVVCMAAWAAIFWVGSKVFGSIKKLYHEYKNKNTTEHESREPGLFVTRYRTWKERTCMKIDFQ